jgi:hypothetical protein
MARKTLLTETEIRRFMKLAQMNPVGTGKLEELAMEAEEEDVLDLGPEGGEEGIEAEVELEEPGGEVSLSDDEAEALAAAKPAVDKIAAEVGEVEETEEAPEELDVSADVDLPGVGDLDVSAQEEVPGARYQEARIRRRIMQEVSGRRQAWDDWKNEHADDDHIEEMEHHLRALKEDRDYERKDADYDDDEYLKEADKTKLTPEEEEAQRQAQMARRHASKGRHRPGGGTPQNEIVDQDDLVHEVARRVAARLAKENQQEEMVDHLAERIMARLVK